MTLDYEKMRELWNLYTVLWDVCGCWNWLDESGKVREYSVFDFGWIWVYLCYSCQFRLVSRKGFYLWNEMGHAYKFFSSQDMQLSVWMWCLRSYKATAHSWEGMMVLLLILKSENFKIFLYFACFEGMLGFFLCWFLFYFFAAALLIGGSIQLYSRKVEYLYSLVLHALEFILEKGLDLKLFRSLLIWFCLRLQSCCTSFFLLALVMGFKLFPF